MISSTYKTILCLAAMGLGVTTSMAQTDDDDDARAERGNAKQPDLETCFAVPITRDRDVVVNPATPDFRIIERPFANLSVFSDQHVYLRTIGNNHYLVTTDECEDFERAYRRGRASIVPYGRTVCQNDGSYFFYEEAGRVRTCPILTVQRVENRAAAKSLAEGDNSLVQIEDATPDE